MYIHKVNKETYKIYIDCIYIRTTIEHILIVYTQDQQGDIYDLCRLYVHKVNKETYMIYIDYIHKVNKGTYTIYIDYMYTRPTKRHIQFICTQGQQ